MKIGVVSDTHGFFDPRLLELFAGVGHILHAGDIGQQRVIVELETLAPVTAVLGNTDVGLSFKETEVVPLVGRKFLVHHIVDPRQPAEPLKDRLAGENPDVVVFGHTHKPYCETLGRTLFLNPGYAGKPRFGMPRSVAIIECNAGGLTCRFHEL